MATYLERLATRAIGRAVTPRSVAPTRTVMPLDDPFERVETASTTAVPPRAMPDRDAPGTFAAAMPAPPVEPTTAPVASAAPAAERAAVPPAPPPAAPPPLPVAARPQPIVTTRVLVPTSAPGVTPAQSLSGETMPREPASPAPTAVHDDLWAALERVALQSREAAPAAAPRPDALGPPPAAPPPVSLEPQRATPPRQLAAPEPRLTIGKVLVEVVAPPQQAAQTVRIVHARVPRTDAATSSPFRRSFGLGQS